MIRPGLDRVAANPLLLENMGRIGLVTNQSVTDETYRSAVEVIWNAANNCKKSELSSVFGAQHGYYQTEQYNMLETADSDMVLPNGKKIPLFSLYSEKRIPTAEQLRDVDTLVVDLRDIGGRVYTYMLTMAGCLRAAAQFGKRVVVLDRPNPLGLCEKQSNGRWSRVEGNRIDLRWSSFVGWYSIPMRHGLTMGELGRFFVSEDKLNVDFKVIEVENLKRSTPLSAIRELAFVMPSPNIPSWLSAFFFPAFVALEGTNLCEGRGTTLPFQLIGAPFLNTVSLIEFLKRAQKNNSSPATSLNGVQFRSHNFRPTFYKYMGELCHGIQFHPTEPEQTHIFSLGMHFLHACVAEHGTHFKWREPGYEYNYKDNPILLILGDEFWLNHFESVRGKGLNDSTEVARLSEILGKCDVDAQKFAEATAFTHLY